MKPDLSCIAAIAFDLDGTLVDSAPDIGHALNTALADGGLSCFDLATVRTWIGDGPDALISRALAAQDVSPDDAGLRQRLRRGFDEATLAAPLDNGCVYPGIADLLDSLHGVLPMAVVTNKPTRLAQAVLAGPAQAGAGHVAVHRRPIRLAAVPDADGGRCTARHAGCAGGRVSCCAGRLGLRRACGAFGLAPVAGRDATETRQQPPRHGAPVAPITDGFDRLRSTPCPPEESPP